MEEKGKPYPEDAAERAGRDLDCASAGEGLTSLQVERGRGWKDWAGSVWRKKTCWWGVLKAGYKVGDKLFSMSLGTGQEAMGFKLQKGDSGWILGRPF